MKEKRPFHSYDAVIKQYNKLQPAIDTKQIDYCCLRFKESVEEKKFLSINDNKLLKRNMIVWHIDHKYNGKKYINNKKIDETQWFMPEWLHIYYCPFCGTYIKGKGFGTPPKRIK